MKDRVLDFILDHHRAFDYLLRGVGLVAAMGIARYMSGEFTFTSALVVTATYFATWAFLSRNEK
jgi:hypothetical protein